MGAELVANVVILAGDDGIEVETNTELNDQSLGELLIRIGTEMVEDAPEIPRQADCWGA